MKAKRYYYRCGDCLSTVVLEERLFEVECICGGELEYLGPVTDTGHWKKVEEKSPCDGRCTGARGWKCDCVCGGENHGTKLVVTVERIGGVARVRPPDQDAIRRAEEYRAARQEVKDALARVFGEDYRRFVERRWVQSRTAWESMWAVKREMKAIARLATHATRIRRLRELAERVSKLKGR
jgi:hypothetical protein